MKEYNTGRWFEYGGKYYLHFGLMQIWHNHALSDKENKWADPPIFREEVTNWLNAHKIVEMNCDGLEFIFPSEETLRHFAMEFDINLRQSD